MLKYADVDSKAIAKCAIQLAISSSREEENRLKESFSNDARFPVKSCAVDFGGDFLSSINKIIERALIASRREGLIDEVYRIDGAIAGATREACVQIYNKAIGFNIGGKVGIAKSEADVAVCVFFGIGLLHLDEIAIGLGHRAI